MYQNFSDKEKENRRQFYREHNTIFSDYQKQKLVE